MVAFLLELTNATTNPKSLPCSRLPLYNHRPVRLLRKPQKRRLEAIQARSVPSSARLSGASLEKARHDQLLTALRALLLSRKNPFGDIKSDGTVKTALENLGLGEAAKRDVGTGENQIPDMSAWKRNPSSNRWRKLPDGTIIQMGISASGPLGSPVNITLPISFSNTNYCVVASYDNARSGVSTMVSFAALPVSPSQFSLMSSVTEQGINPFAYWIAFGD